MESTSPSSVSESIEQARPAVFGYERAAVDDFLAAAGRERERLETEIAESQARERKARAAIGMHRVMVSMLLETQIELEEKRRDAETEAAAILARAEEDALRIEASASGVVATPINSPIGRPTALESLSHIDLQRAESIDDALRSPAQDDVAANSHTDDADQYFEFLRGALADDEPLGPRPA